MSAVKNTKVRDKNSASDNSKLSMRAAREAQNGLSATLANVRTTTAGLTEQDAAERRRTPEGRRLQRGGP